MDAHGLERYRRNLLIPELGPAGQAKLAAGRVLVVGAGGLGSPALYQLACAGVGTLGIMDHDRVELSNLQRQFLHFTRDIGRPKVDSALDKLLDLNPALRFRIHPETFTAENGADLISDYDFVVEATDNFEAKFGINDACVRAGVPFSHGGVIGLIGQTMTVLPGAGPCVRCVFKEAPNAAEVQGADQAGVLGAVPGIIGSIQALEAVKYLAGFGRLLLGRMITFDAGDCRFREVTLPPLSCALCREAFPQSTSQET